MYLVVAGVTCSVALGTGALYIHIQSELMPVKYHLVPSKHKFQIRVRDRVRVRLVFLLSSVLGRGTGGHHYIDPRQLSTGFFS